MAAENQPNAEKVVDLWDGISLWKVHLDALREQDVNARVMPKEKFDRLVENLKATKKLESLPLVTPIVNPAGNLQFSIISGHHRTRAARAAGIMEIFVLVYEEQLTKDQIISKQLAHNALSGYDNPDLLAELYGQIEDISEKLASGLTDIEIQVDTPDISAKNIVVEFEFEPIYILFLPRQLERFEEVLDTLEKDSKKYLADYKDFDKFKKVVTDVSKREDIRNIGGIMARMMDIVQEYYKANPASDNDKA